MPPDHKNRTVLYVFLAFATGWFLATMDIRTQFLRNLAWSIANSNLIIRHANAPAAVPGGAAGSAVDTSGWKTYRNEKYGFELQFPPQWGSPIEKDSAILFGTPASDEDSNPLNLSIAKANGKTIDQIISEEGSEKGVYVSDVEKTTVGGVEARRFTSKVEGGFAGRNLSALKGDYYYEFSYGTRFVLDPLPSSSVQVELALSTFKFIEPASSTPE